MAIIEVRLVDGEGRSWGRMLATDKVFRTGSLGYHGHSKLIGADGKVYQAQVQLVLVGSKQAARPGVNGGAGLFPPGPEIQLQPTADEITLDLEREGDGISWPTEPEISLELGDEITLEIPTHKGVNT